MAADAGPDRAALIQALSVEAPHYGFFELMLALESLHPDAARAGESGPLSAEVLRLRSNTSLGFPPGDVESVRAEDGRVNVELNFMGLSGVSSPLPGFFQEPVVRQVEGSGPLRDLLGIFEHRFYGFFWRAWKKYRLDLFLERDEARSTRLLLHLVGATWREVGPDHALDARRLISFAGLLGTPHRTAAGLRNLVSGYFGGLPVRVAENARVRVWARDRAHLGSPGDGGPRLAETALLGDRLDDRSSTVVVHIGPIGLGTYRSLLPGGGRARALGALVRFGLPGEIDFRIELELSRDEVPPCRLGDPGTTLGRVSWIGRVEANGISGWISPSAYAAA